MPARRESNLASLIATKLRQRGAYVVKQHGSVYSVAGTPDLLVCYRGVFIGLEVKTQRMAAKATPLQEAAMQAIRDAGGYACIVRSADEALRVLTLANAVASPDWLA